MIPKEFISAFASQSMTTSSGTTVRHVCRYCTRLATEQTYHMSMTSWSNFFFFFFFLFLLLYHYLIIARIIIMPSYHQFTIPIHHSQSGQSRAVEEQRQMGLSMGYPNPTIEWSFSQWNSLWNSQRGWCFIPLRTQMATDQRSFGCSASEPKPSRIEGPCRKLKPSGDTGHGNSKEEFQVYTLTY